MLGPFVSDHAKAKRVEAVVDFIANDLTYIPSPEQRRLKQAFWARFNDNPVCDPQDITRSIVEAVAPDSRINRWWPQSGFKEWFINKEEFREEVDALVFLALDRMKRILISEDPKMASAQVSAAKLLMDVGRKMPPKISTEKFLDEKIHQMDRKQLEEYLAKSMKLIPSKDLTEEINDVIIDEATQPKPEEP
jgi:hypothetical protein